MTPCEVTSTAGCRNWSETRTSRHRRKALAFDLVWSRAALGSPYPGELSSAARDTRLLGTPRESDPERAPNESRGNSRASTYCLRVESSHPNTFRPSRVRGLGCRTRLQHLRAHRTNAHHPSRQETRWVDLSWP